MSSEKGILAERGTYPIYRKALVPEDDECGADSIKKPRISQWEWDPRYWGSCGHHYLRLPFPEYLLSAGLRPVFHAISLGVSTLTRSPMGTRPTPDVPQVRRFVKRISARARIEK